MSVIQLQELIKLYDQQDTLNIFGKNVFTTNPANIIPNTFDPCIDNNNQTINNCVSCTQTLVSSHSDQIVDYVLMLDNLYSLTGTVYDSFGIYSFTGDTGTTATTSENTLFELLSDYYSSYNAVFNPPNSTNITTFNTAKKALLDFICTFIENGTSLEEDFPNINNLDGFGYNTLNCIITNIQRILCTCGSNVCNCKTQCENLILERFGELNNLFIGSATTFVTSGGPTTITYTTPDIDLINTSNIPNIVFTDSEVFSVELGYWIDQYIILYTLLLICPCNVTLKNQFSELTNELKQQLENIMPGGINYAEFTAVFTGTFVSGTEIRNMDLYDFSLTQWYNAFQNIISNIVYTIYKCPIITKCDCVASCESKIISNFNNLYTDILSSIDENIDTWKGVTNGISGITLTVPYDPFNQPSTIITTKTLNKNTINVEFKFKTVGYGVYCNTEDEVNIVPGVSLPYIALPNILITEIPSGPVSCVTTTKLSLGDDVADLYTAFFNYKTSLCDGTRAEKRQILQEALEAVEPYVCVTDICGVADLSVLLGQIIQQDFAELCCLISKCKELMCCKENYISKFIIDLLKTVELPAYNCKVKLCKKCKVEKCRCNSCNDSCESNTIVSNHKYVETTCNFDMSQLIDILLTTNKCVDNKQMMTLIYTQIIVPLQEQLCCIRKNLENSKDQLASFSDELCALNKENYYVRKDNDRLNDKIKEAIYKENETKNTLNCVIRKLNDSENRADRLTVNVYKCCGQKECICKPKKKCINPCQNPCENKCNNNYENYDEYFDIAPKQNQCREKDPCSKCINLNAPGRVNNNINNNINNIGNGSMNRTCNSCTKTVDTMKMYNCTNNIGNNDIIERQEREIYNLLRRNLIN